MIGLTRLNGTKFYVNALLIEMIEETPDTLITLTTGKKLLVLENSSDVNRSIRQYLRSIGVLAAVTGPAANPQSEGATS
ncbi:flagellar FlbD family protein [Cohnella thailandensis]|uniref:Flagellar FlbD family protein n=1 Tax=Cohnella thailandensis TaxID=557557 RepID=A0A841T2W3_9BACL|nr:flagellar FlbD family protein [Cohnella thailandensis]MBB6636708.1 flagellar FlbD family protein [Cohnella thailandensis]MBP1973416.1 flagellar protein FlbD [Cohnella thailandensis]